METVITVVLLLFMGAFLVLMFLGRRDELLNVKSRSSIAQTTVAVPAGSVVKIRHASDSLELQVSGPDIYPGPLSDASLDNTVWDRITSRECTREEKIRLAEKLSLNGFHVTIDGVGEFGAKRASEVIDPSGVVYHDDGPVGDLVPAPLSSAPSLEKMQSSLMEATLSGKCHPAFAAVASRLLGFSTVFLDKALQERSQDPQEQRRAEEFSDLIFSDLPTAMHRYMEKYPLKGGVHSIGSAAEGQTPQGQLQQPKSVVKPSAILKAPKYAFNNLR